MKTAPAVPLVVLLCTLCLVACSNWPRDAADRGDPEAQYNLGVWYEKGRNVPQDYAEAAKWYRASAEQGYAGAQYNLGSLYVDGLGVPQDHDAAVTWYDTALEYHFLRINTLVQSRVPDPSIQAPALADIEDFNRGSICSSLSLRQYTGQRPAIRY